MKSIEYIKRTKYSPADMLLLVAIVFQHFGELPIISITPNTLALFLIGAVALVKVLAQKQKLLIPYKLFLVIGYVALITFTHYFDSTAVKNFVLFIAFTVSFALYFLNEPDKEKIFSILYFGASILAIYGMIQEFSYILGIPYIYDPTNFGFVVFYISKLSGPFICMYSLYSEPSHLAGILCVGILLGVITDKEKKHYAFTNSVLTVLIIIGAVLTGSATVYVGLFLVAIAVIVNLKLPARYKLFIILGGIAAVSVFFLAFPRIYHSVVEYRLLGLINEFYIVGNWTTFAIISNLRAAIAKFQDGNIFGTGFDSNGYYYYDYVDKIYGSSTKYMNAGDAASLFTRVFSEFGIVGLIAMLAFLIHRTYRGLKTSNWHILIMVTLFVVQGLRNGSYLDTMFVVPLIALLYYKGLEDTQNEQK